MKTTIVKNVRNIVALIAVLFLTKLGLGQITEIINTAGSGSWEVPCGVNSVTIHLYGAGGGGGGSDDNAQAGGGGGAGGYAVATYVVVPGQMIPYNIGAGGANGTKSIDGTAGGQTDLGAFSTMYATGGQGGQCQNNGWQGGAAGMGYNGTTNLAGTDGAPGNYNGPTIGGPGGAHPGPHSGTGGVGGAAGVEGADGPLPGTGGGGGGAKSGSSNPDGGSGADGAVAFEYTTTVTTPDAGEDLTLCGVTNLSGNTPDIGWTGTWSVISGSATINDVNDPNTGISGISAGSCATFQWTFSAPGCKDFTDQVTICNPVLCNDEPCGAIPLPVGSGTCSYNTFSNVGSTGSTGMAEPGCGSYLDNDVWFSVTIPANGIVTVHAIDAPGGSSMYPGLAVYEGTCTELYHQGCDNSTSTSSSSPAEITYTGTPGETLYIRYFNYFEYESDFQICAYTTASPTGTIMPGMNNTCGGTFMDPGGTGNYEANSFSQYVICPDTPGSYVTVDFCSGANFFDIENGFDLLTVLDGDYDSSQIIGQYTGTTIPCTFTSGTPDGCLTFQFQSDYIINDLGWQASVSCTNTMANNIAEYDCSPTNCSGECGQWICQDGLYPTENIGNAVEDLALGTSGCFGAAGEIASRWFYFTVLTDGTIEFSFDGPNGQDYDFAIWGPSTNGIPPCPMNTGDAPIRCSFAAVGNTGNPVGLNESVAGGEQFEGAEGDGWVDALQVQAGETYAMILNIYMNGNPQPVIDLTIGGSGTLDCTPVFLPVEMHSLTGINQRDRNLISWITSTELNNDFFTLERSANGYDWEYAGTIEGAGTSMTPRYYSLFDYQPHFPVTYYRVKQTDFDGKFEYSETIAVNADRITGEGIISEVFPNPAGDYTSFAYNGTGVSSQFPLNVRILDDFGHEVLNYDYTESKADMPIMVNTEGLAGGAYSLVATQGDQVTRRKLVIAR